MKNAYDPLPTSWLATGEWNYISCLTELVNAAEADNAWHRSGGRTAGTDTPLFGKVLEIPIGREDDKEPLFKRGPILPAFVSKKIYLRSMMAELLWFIEGGDNAKRLNQLGSKIWDEWADADTGYLGEGVYGPMWRRYPGPGEFGESEAVDQLENLVASLIKSPYSRRHIVWAWNPALADQARLPPCHMGFVCQVQEGVDLAGLPVRILNMAVTMRSWDFFLGAPFNVASYGALLQLLCKLTGMEAGKLTFFGVDVHLYHNCLEQAKQQVSRWTKAIHPYVTKGETPPGLEHDNHAMIEWHVEPGSGVDGLRDLTKRVNALDSNDHSSIYTIYYYNSFPPLPAPITV